MQAISLLFPSNKQTSHVTCRRSMFLLISSWLRTLWNESCMGWVWCPCSWCIPTSPSTSSLMSLLCPSLPPSMLPQRSSPDKCMTSSSNGHWTASASMCSGLPSRPIVDAGMVPNTSASVVLRKFTQISPRDRDGSAGAQTTQGCQRLQRTCSKCST